MELTFVVGTGRCGSTLLSRLLREHPDVLSMSEFFSTLRIAAASGRPRFPASDMDGAQLWRLLASPFPMLDAMISDGLRTSEMLYPDHGRFGADTGIPLVSHYILPMLGADPDWLFDELAAEVPRWPRRPAAAQYQNLFGYLSGLLGRPVVVERSASSLHLIPLLHAQFPAARFVHLYRDGPDCALSMSRASRVPPGDPGHRRGAGRESSPRVRRCSRSTTRCRSASAASSARPMTRGSSGSFPIPVEVFGRDRWSPMICAGVAALGPGCPRPAGQPAVRGPDSPTPRPAWPGSRRFIGISAPAGLARPGLPNGRSDAYRYRRRRARGGRLGPAASGLRARRPRPGRRRALGTGR